MRSAKQRESAERKARRWSGEHSNAKQRESMESKAKRGCGEHSNAEQSEGTESRAEGAKSKANLHRALKDVAGRRRRFQIAEEDRRGQRIGEVQERGG